MHAPTTHKVNTREMENNTCNHAYSWTMPNSRSTHINTKITRITSDMGAIRQHAYSWASPSTRDPKNKDALNGNMQKESHKTTRLLLGVAKYKEYTNQNLDSMCHECINTTRLLLVVARNKES